VEETYSRTGIFILDEDLWKWAKFRADTRGFNSVSEYVFELIELDKIEDLKSGLVQKVDEKEVVP